MLWPPLHGGDVDDDDDDADKSLTYEKPHAVRIASKQAHVSYSTDYSSTLQRRDSDAR
jgi:hypothetical protein